ncbi:MAG: hypothetical protein GWO07_14990 [Candidatus Dadabacteria bacterium]|nr:hypothetical protein [Candidatus Dadabacteria bacterium]NIS10017.1 hypothetical protein [Candidatus Dadabacteria bacterium]NIV42023.1 hypothetical protein [Candidatus Dadabacteria bacterium]NIX15233.1 hypothetical protein [Candidatus Dadabacteria bacterium]NIY22989.1 hypothetical protein [Candidatus Dadabacteria bacterium]
MSLSNITGHDFQKEFLIKSVEKNRVASPYLFYGREGIGKRLIAIEFAKLLNCQRQVDRLSQNPGHECACASCLKTESANHPDVTLVSPRDSSEIKVKQIREQIEDLIYLKPYEGKYKISIIDDAESMNINAQNAFLKTLEEPPADAVIILISSKPQYLLKTITSRCHSLEFFRMNDEAIETAIKAKSELSAQLRGIAVRLSQGSLSKAFMLDEQLISERKRIIESISELHSDNPASLLEFVDSIAKDKTSSDLEYKMFFETLFLWLKDILYLKSDIDRKNLVHGDLTEISAKFSEIWSVDYILELRAFLEQAWDSLLFRNVNKQFVLENLAIKFAKA